MPGFPVYHQLPKLTQIHVHPVGDAIQPSHLLSTTSPPAPQSFPASGSFPMSQLFTSGGQSIGSFSFNISPSNEHPGLISFRMDWWISLLSKGLSRVFSSTTIQKHRFFSTQSHLWFNSHIHIRPLEKPPPAYNAERTRPLRSGQDCPGGEELQ